MQEVYCSEPLSVGRNTPLIPVETVLTLAAQIAGSVVKLVNINQSVALGHFSGGKRHEINAAPWGILLFYPQAFQKTSRFSRYELFGVYGGVTILRSLSVFCPNRLRVI